MYLKLLRVLSIISTLILVPETALAVNAEISVKGESVIYAGDLVSDSLNQILVAVEKRKVSRLIIRSGGGEVTGAIKLAHWIHDNGIDVEVDQDCFSSCANYVFTSGRNKLITGRGIVGWHGTLSHQLYRHTNEGTKFDAPTLESIHTIVALEKALYSKTGVNGAIGWFGKVTPYGVHNMYFMSKEDMEYFGLKNLHVRSDYEKTDLSRYLDYDSKLIRLLKLDRSVPMPINK